MQKVINHPNFLMIEITDYDQEMDVIPDNVYLETIRKHAKKDILLCHININSIHNNSLFLAIRYIDTTESHLL